MYTEARVRKTEDASTSMDSKTHSSDDLQCKPRQISGIYNLAVHRPARTCTSLQKFMPTHAKTAGGPKFHSTVCETVEEDQLGEVEEKRRPLTKIKLILDKREDLLFDPTRRKSTPSLTSLRSRSSEVTLPKVIETKEEYSGFVEKRKPNFAKYLALIDKSDSAFLSKILSQNDPREEPGLASEDPIEENPCEDGMAEEAEDRSFSVKSGSLSRLSANSFAKKKIIDEVILFDREKEMSEIVG